MLSNNSGLSLLLGSEVHLLLQQTLQLCFPQTFFTPSPRFVQDRHPLPTVPVWLWLSYDVQMGQNSTPAQEEEQLIVFPSTTNQTRGPLSDCWCWISRMMLHSLLIKTCNKDFIFLPLLEPCGLFSVTFWPSYKPLHFPPPSDVFI